MTKKVIRIPENQKKNFNFCRSPFSVFTAIPAIRAHPKTRKRNAKRTATKTRNAVRNNPQAMGCESLKYRLKAT
ncbi:Uncharacterized protein APZ42_029064 [Daphnia magna]|uniref:Uncharacterized protein n=1 Tax=Daphnia magna TaxID=35525 RepID=A0A164PYA5_9CRUS|nr:Uncharacterized protein APZ42_029064 [Daphnia magna]